MFVVDVEHPLAKCEELLALHGAKRLEVGGSRHEDGLVPLLAGVLQARLPGYGKAVLDGQVEARYESDNPCPAVEADHELAVVLVRVVRDDRAVMQRLRDPCLGEVCDFENLVDFNCRLGHFPTSFIGMMKRSEVFIPCFIRFR